MRVIVVNTGDKFDQWYTDNLKYMIDNYSNLNYDKFEVIDEECVACNMCINVCPVENCITMRDLEPGEIDKRTGQTVSDKYANWTTHPNNPSSIKAAE